MNCLSGTALILLMHAFLLCMPRHASAVTVQPDLPINTSNTSSVDWTSSSVQHVIGLPDAKPKDKGTLTIAADGITFTGKSSRSVIQRSSIIAVSAGNQRVELWGMKGRLLRMAIPNGGGLAAAGVMHHRVDMLTVEFADARGGYHGAVFFLPANEAEQALQSFADMPAVERDAPATVCRNDAVKQHSVLVAAPDWDQADVPAAYRALVYEHLVDRLQRVEGMNHVYRDGENDGHPGCPQYTIHVAIAGFKQGSQVKRAVMGPVGMFVGTTQMTFDATVTDASGRLNRQEQVKATVRGESESANVADGVAKSLAKHYSKTQKDFEKWNAAGVTRARS